MTHIAGPVGIRELQQNASRLGHLAGSGEQFEIADRGRPVAALVRLRTRVLDPPARRAAGWANRPGRSASWTTR